MIEDPDDRRGDDAVRAALRGLPAAAPGPAFTARVLARIDRPHRSRRARVPAWVTAGAAVAALVAMLWGAAVGRQSWTQQQRRAELREESAALRRELEALHDEAAKKSPVLYLGGNEQLDVVLDLSTLPIAAAAPAAATSTLGGGRR